MHNGFANDINKDCLQNYYIVISVLILKFLTVRCEQIVCPSQTVPRPLSDHGPHHHRNISIHKVPQICSLNIVEMGGGGNLGLVLNRLATSLNIFF